MSSDILYTNIDIDLKTFYPAFMKYGEHDETLTDFILRFAKTHYEILEAQEIVE